MLFAYLCLLSGLLDTYSIDISILEAMKLVSVIVPVYGVERYIADTINSVLSQTYQYYELILVDDGGLDLSVEICKQFSDSRIQIIHQANRGLAGARNTGIRHSKGDYLAFLDGDDLWGAEKLEKHVQHLDEHPSIGISYGRSLLIDENGYALGTYLMPKLKNIALPHFFRENPIGNGSSAVIRREVLESIKFHDNIYGVEEPFYFDDHFRRAEDIELWLRIAIQTSWKFEGIPEVLTLYRINSGGLSASLEKQLDAWEQVLFKIKSYSPDIFQEWGDIGFAYRLRYLSRSAIRLKNSKMAFQYINQAIVTRWQILLEEPRRTVTTLFAAYLLLMLPLSLYIYFEKKAAKFASILQNKKIQEGLT